MTKVMADLSQTQCVLYLKPQAVITKSPLAASARNHRNNTAGFAAIVLTGSWHS